jgi:hypothetical protein
LAAGVRAAGFARRSLARDMSLLLKRKAAWCGTGPPSFLSLSS